MPKKPAAPAITQTTARRTLRLATWNINSVRLRHPLIAQIVAALDPDVLCLQETKCPDELLPAEELRALGFPYVAAKGMKGYFTRSASGDVDGVHVGGRLATRAAEPAPAESGAVLTAP